MTALDHAGVSRYITTDEDILVPEVIFTNLEDNQILTESSFVIRGEARDDGGSGLREVSLCIDNNCQVVSEPEGRAVSWQYEWNDIVNGSYDLSVRVVDNYSNRGASEHLTIEVAVPSDPVVFSTENSSTELLISEAEADGIDYVEVKATILDNYGQVMVNELISFNEVVDNNNNEIEERLTNAKGEVTFQLRSIVAGQKQLSLRTTSGATVADTLIVDFSEVTIDIDYTSGRWIKLPNQTAVYFLDSNDIRHAYSTQKVWESYFGEDFSSVEIVSASQMASYSLGRNVPFKVGTLMKIPSVPKVYYVSHNGRIGWIQSEAVAILMFGGDWADSVVDLPESFFPDYIEQGSLN